jgi:hypothetical protein
VKFQLGGMLGKMVNMFGGRAREGVVSTVAVKGNRMATMSDANGQIIDLLKRRSTTLTSRRRPYTVTTFAELRKRMEEARRGGREERAANARGRAVEAIETGREAILTPRKWKSTPTSRTRRDAHHQRLQHDQSVMITVREKGKTLNESGGMADY